MQSLSINALWVSQSFIAFIQKPKVESIIIKIISFIFLIELLLSSALYIKFFKFHTTTPIVLAAYHNESMGIIPLKPATELFINKINNITDINAIADGKVKRNIFNTEGRTISLQNDNFQIFEYADSNIAQTNATIVIKEYEYNKKIHIYQKNNLIIFYMGNNQKILKVLSE